MPKGVNAKEFVAEPARLCFVWGVADWSTPTYAPFPPLPPPPLLPSSPKAPCFVTLWSRRVCHVAPYSSRCKSHSCRDTFPLSPPSPRRRYFPTARVFNRAYAMADTNPTHALPQRSPKRPKCHPPTQSAANTYVMDEKGVAGCVWRSPRYPGSGGSRVCHGQRDRLCPGAANGRLLRAHTGELG